MNTDIPQRQVIQGIATNPQQNPVRAVSTIAVQHARGGQFKDLSNGERLLKEAGKFGDIAYEKYQKKRKEEEIVNAQLAYTQGVTEGQLAQMGASSDALEAYRGLQLKDAANQKYLQLEQNISVEDHKLTTDQFRKKLQATFKEDSAYLDNTDDSTRALAAELHINMGSKLIQQHAVQHAQYKQKASFDAATNFVINESKVSEPSDLRDLINNFNEVTPLLDDAQRRKVLQSAVTQTLNEGSYALYDALGGSTDALRKHGFDGNQIDTIKRALDQAQNVTITNNHEAIQDSVDQVVKDFKAGNSSVIEAFEQIKNITTANRLNKTFYNQTVQNIRKVALEVGMSTEIADKMNDPEFREQLANVKMQAALNGNVDIPKEVTRLGEKFNIPPEALLNVYATLGRSADRYENKLLQNAENQINAAEDNRKLDAAANALLINKNFAGSSSKEQQRALDILQQKIVNKVMLEAETTGQALSDAELKEKSMSMYVHELSTLPIVDKNFQGVLSGAINTPPVDKNGKVNDTHLQSLNVFYEMKSQGISEKVIKEYFGNSYDYFSVVSTTANATDPATALSATYEALNNQDGTRPPVSNLTDIMDNYPSIKENIKDNVEPSWLGGLFSKPQDGKYYEVITSQVEAAFENSPHVDSYFKSQVNKYRKQYPMLNSQDITNLAKRDLNNIEYVMGNLIVPQNGQSISKLMGLDKEEGNLLPNRAAIHYIRDNIKELLPPDGVSKFQKVMGASGIMEAYDILFRDSEEQDFEDAKFNKSLLIFSEEYQRTKEGIRTVDIVPTSNGNLLITIFDDTDKGNPVFLHPIPAKEIGEYYKKTTRERTINENLPER